MMGQDTIHPYDDKFLEVHCGFVGVDEPGEDESSHDENNFLQFDCLLMTHGYCIAFHPWKMLLNFKRI